MKMDFGFSFFSPQEQPSTRQAVEQVSRQAAVRMLYEALQAMTPAQACNAVLAAIRDRDGVTPDQLEEMSKALGREAHERARKEMK